MLNLTPYRQKIAHCGPAALKIVLAFYGIEASEKELASSSGCTLARGTSAKGLLAAAKSFGLTGEIHDMSKLSDLKNLLKRGIPPIVDWFSVDEGHYSVVAKIDEANIWLQDPELGQLRAMRHEVFMRVWFDFSSAYMKTREDLILRRHLVIYPPPEQRATFGQKTKECPAAWLASF